MGSYGASGLDRSHIAAQRFGVTGPVWMAGIIVGSAVVLMALGLLVPGARMENLPEKLVAIGLGVVQVAILLVLRRRTPMWVLWGVLTTFTVTAAVLVATAPTAIGALSFVFGPVAVGVYAGVWGSRAIAASMFGIILVSGTVALAVSGRLGEVLYVWAGFAALCLGVIVLLQLVVAELTRNAVVDPLTGLLNRRGLTGAISGAVGGAGPTSVVIIDVDDFKQINDRAGHDQGDRVLCDLPNTGAGASVAPTRWRVSAATSSSWCCEARMLRPPSHCCGGCARRAGTRGRSGWRSGRPVEASTRRSPRQTPACWR